MPRRWLGVLRLPYHGGFANAPLRSTAAPLNPPALVLNNSPFQTALRDLAQTLRAWRLWSLLGWLEIRQRYARSKLGPFWLTISTGVLVATLGVVYGTLMGQKLSGYLPIVAIGLVVWTLFSAAVNEGAMAYINSANYIRQAQTPRLVYVFQVVWRNLVIFAHNAVIVLVVLLLFGVHDWRALPLFLPGLALFVLNATWIAMAVGLLSARFRDLPQIIAALLQVAFYVTPILFRGDMLPARAQWIVRFNPLGYWVDLVREPLMGVFPSPLAWAVGGVAALLGWAAALALTGRYHRRIPYWI